MTRRNVLRNARQRLNSMKRNSPFSRAVLVACLLASVAQGDAKVSDQTDAPETLAVRIELARTDETPAVNFYEPLNVVLVNDSDQTLVIWNPDTRSGYDQLSFHFRNLRSGETHLVRKRRIDDEKYWKARGDNTESDPATIEIAPKESVTTRVSFGEAAWGERAWEGLPAPNSGDRFAVTAQFQSTVPEDASGRKVRARKIQSIPINARVIAPALRTPRDYLQSGFSRAAIAMMGANPKWITARDENSCTPLHDAATYGHRDAVKWLLDHGANVNAIAYNGFTPLHLASDPGVIELILGKQPDLTIRCRAVGQTPLQRAAANLVGERRLNEQEKWRRIVKLYLDSGADYDLVTAIQLGDLERVKRIINKTPACADDFQGESPLRTAAALRRLEICRYLIDQHHVNVNDFDRGNGYPIIKEALPYPRVVELLIKSGADLKTRITWRAGRIGQWIIGDDATALHYAAEDGVPETITLLIDHGVDTFAMAHDLFGTESRQTALEVAASLGRADNANAIVSHPRFDRVDQKLRQEVLDTSLCRAVGRAKGEDEQRPKLAKILLDKGANPSAARDGVTAMRLAANQIHPNEEIENAKIQQQIKFLRDHGAVVDLFSAVAIGDEEEVRRLLKSNPASANSRGPDGYPALHFAVRMNDANIVRALLGSGCEIDIRNKCEHTGCIEETPLHCAAFWGRYEFAKLLLDAGADVNALTNRKSTPLHEAAHEKRENCSIVTRARSQPRGTRR